MVLCTKCINVWGSSAKRIVSLDDTTQYTVEKSAVLPQFTLNQDMQRLSPWLVSNYVQEDILL